MEPARTCLGCRRREARSALLRLVQRGGAVVPDTSATLPGRGAWVHRRRECVEAAVRRRAFGRAFRTSEPLDVGALLAAVGAEPGPTTEQADQPMDN